MDNKNLSIENYNNIKEEQYNRGVIPHYYNANVGVGVGSSSTPSTYNQRANMEYYNQLKEDGKTPQVDDLGNEITYLGKSAKTGFLKGMDLIGDIANFPMNKLFGKSEVDLYIEQLAKESIKEKDAFYLANKEDVGIPTQLIGGLVEQLSNPVELLVNAFETYITGGANIYYRLGKTALYNFFTTVGLENYYSKKYEDRFLSAEENLKVGLTAATLSTAMGAYGEFKGKLAQTKNIGGDVDAKINVRAEMDNFNDVYTYKGDNAQKIYTNYPEHASVKSDPYVFVDVSDRGVRDVKMVLGAGSSDKSLYYNYGSSALEVGNYIDKVEIQNILEQGMNNQKLKVEQGNSTVLSRRFDEIETLGKVGEYVNEVGLNEEFAGKLTDIGYKVPKNFSKKDVVNQNTVLQNKMDNSISELIEDVMPTVSQTYSDVKMTWKKDSSAKPTVTSYNQIDMALNKIDAKYQTQKLYVQNEYLNKINGVEGKMSVEDYIKSLGKDKKTIAGEWVNGMKGTVDGDSNGFLKVAYEDSIRLDELNMKTSLYDIDDFKEFQASYGKHFDENGDIIFNDDLFDTIAKLDKNSDDYNTILNAMKDNTHEWVEFIASSKDKLEGQFTAKEIKKLEKEANRIIHKMKSEKQALEAKILNSEKELKSIKKDIKDMEKDGLTDTKEYYDLVTYADTHFKNLIEESKADLDKWTSTKYKEYVDRLSDIDNYKETHTNVQVHDKILANRLNKNKDFIETEYNKILQGVDIKNKEPKVWKKEVAMNITNNKKALAEESIKINQVINKKNLLGGVQEYFTESVYKDNLGKVELKADKINDFIAEVLPFYQNGTINLPKGLTTDMDLTSPENAKLIANNFKEFIADLKLTRQSTKVVGEYKTLGELRDYFVEGQMSNFFLNFKNGDYVKTNAEIVRDIFDKNTSQTARYIAYGSTSPFSMRNKLQQIGNTAKKLNPNLSDTEKGIISNFVGQRGINMLNHTQNLVSTPQDLTRKVNSFAQKAIATKYLVGTGIEELTGQNIAIALYRGQKFGGAKIYVNTAQFQTMKMAKHTSAVDVGDLGKYNLGNLRHSMDMKQATDGVWDKYMEVGLMAQKMSDNQLKKIADVVSTATLDKLPTDYSKLTNEMKSLLKVNGIEEHNYKHFANFTKEHIADNGNYVNMNALVEMVNDNRYDKNADALRNVYYALTDYIGDVKSHTKFDDVKYDAFTSWGNMFRSFSRAMNRDTLTRFTYATNSDGVGITRWTQLKTDPKGLVSDTASGLLVGTMALGVGGLTRDVSKEIIRSGRTFLQRIGVLETKLDTVLDSGVLENIGTLMYSGSAEEIVNELTGSGSSILGSEAKQIKKIWDTFTDEEKQAFGTNYEEGIKELALYVISFTGKPIVNNVSGLMKDDIYDLDKVHGFTKEQQERYESYVRKYIHNTEKLKADIKENIQMSKRQVQSEIDYMDNNNNSFNLLSNEDKEVIETVIKNSNVENKDDLRQEATVLINQGGTKEELVESLSFSRPMDDIKVEDTIKELNQLEKAKEQESIDYKNEFNTFSDKRKKLFKDIMRVQGKKDISDEDYKNFVKIFEGKDSVKLRDILNTYNIKHADLLQGNIKK